MDPGTDSGLAVIRVLALLLLCTLPLRAQERVTLPGTEVHRLTSKHNGIAYKLYVSVPPGYDSSKTKKYGVIYTLDADYSFAIARNVVEHMSDRDHLEPLIVVSIAYDGPAQYRLNRTRDYTPTHTLEGGYGPEYQKVSGGAPKFRDFLTKELIPFIDARYRTIPGRRALSGHSYGGLFSTWMLLTTGTRFFDRYIIVSPSLWYDDRMIFKLPVPAKLAARVYLTVGSIEQTMMATDLARLARSLRSRTTLKHEVHDDETHNSVFPSAFSRGLRFVYEGR